MSSDPTTWGAQTNGFVVPSAAEILEAIENDEKATISPNIDVDADSPVGQINGIVAAQLAEAWEALGMLEAARSRDGAEGALLDETGKLTGSVRDIARPTSVVCTVGLEIGTVLTVDKLASIAGRPDLTFYPVVDATTGFEAPSTGTYTITFKCTQTGPIVVLPTTLTVITTATPGWTSITNAAAGITGTDVATDAEARLEQEQDLALAGSATAAAIAADLPYNATTEEGIPGVLEAYVLENYTDLTDSNGLPPHSIEAVLYVDGTEDADVIAEKLFLAKPAGCATHGEFSGEYTDARGDVHTVYYSTVTSKPVYFTYELSVVEDDYVGDAAVKTAIAAAMAERAEQGVFVNATFAKALPLSLSGVTDVTAFYLGFSASPSGTSNLPIGVRELATFATANIVVTTT